MLCSETCGVFGLIVCTSGSDYPWLTIGPINACRINGAMGASNNFLALFGLETFLVFDQVASSFRGAVTFALEACC